MLETDKQKSWMKKSKLGTRVLVAFTLGPVILVSAYYGGGYFLAVVALIAFVATWEYFALASRLGFRAHTVPGLFGTGLLLWACYSGDFRLAFGSLVGLAVLASLAQIFRGPQGSTAALASTVFGSLYLGGLFGHILLIRELPKAVGLPYDTAGTWIVGLFLTVWVCDTAAYFGGSLFGKRKLAPRVSPGKTWEGALSGLFFALLTAWLADAFFLRGLAFPHVITMGLIVGTFGQASDLAESLFKRDAGVKDSSSLIPGHGGMLDRFDSLILISPVFYWYLRLVAF